ncbi:hypothetical protein QYE76_005248 [Lolium multiflorum]|uniref:Phospholipase D n=1 Tax=Lolium multiflorum TaxID=4521 RepID=A0AAD8W2Y7_LOLMU|nr:hypothetical protein QYE76_005248 [Lolium multiflorum]
MEAIDDAGLRGQAHPCDYLNFFCLGNRETPRPGEYVPPVKPEEGTDYWRAQASLDDEYVIVGSANLNERSLAGNRDSEIAQGSYQPAHLNGSDGGRALGVVHAFRTSLWHEHLMNDVGAGAGVAVSAEPESVECVHAVRRTRSCGMRTRRTGWRTCGGTCCRSRSACRVREVTDLPADGCFPDTKAPVKGRKSATLPAILTT